MEFNEFRDAVIEAVQDILPEKYANVEIEPITVVKNNNTTLEGIVFKDEESGAHPTCYLQSHFEAYENGKPFAEIVNSISVQMVHMMENNTFEFETIKNFDDIKDIIYPHIVNAEQNKNLLEGAPHKLLEDLAITYHIRLDEFANDERVGDSNIMISNALMEHYHTDPETLHDLAIANLNSETPDFVPLSVRIEEEFIASFMANDSMSREDAKGLFDSLASEMVMGAPDLYVISNESGIYGSANILCETLMDTVSKELGGDFYILPSSVHEVLVVPKDVAMTKDELENMVQEVNATCVDVTDKLSDFVYEYDATERVILRADHAEELRKEARENEAKAPNDEHRRVSVKEKMAEMKAVVAANDTKAPTKQKETQLGD